MPVWVTFGANSYPKSYPRPRGVPTGVFGRCGALGLLRTSFSIRACRPHGVAGLRGSRLSQTNVEVAADVNAYGGVRVGGGIREPPAKPITKNPRHTRLMLRIWRCATPRRRPALSADCQGGAHLVAETASGMELLARLRVVMLNGLGQCPRGEQTEPLFGDGARFGAVDGQG